MNGTNALPPSLDTWTTLFLLAAGQGLFLAASLYFNKKGKRWPNFLLGTFILLFAVTLIDYVGYWTRYNAYYPNFRGIYEYLIFMFGPLLFLYFKSVYTGKIVKTDVLHFVAVLVYFFLKLGHWRSWFPNLHIFLNVQAALFMAHLTAYGIWSVSYLQKQREHHGGGAESGAIILGWHRTLLALYAGFVLGWLVYFMIVRTPYFSLLHDYSISFAMTVFIYAVGYLGYKQPEIFSGESMLKVFLPAKYQNSTLTPSAARSIKELLLGYMEKHQPFLDNELRLTSLANELEVSTHHLSQVINENLGKSFSDFVNGYRVEAARKMLAAPEFRETYIIDIAYSAGFNNKTTFNKIFKEMVGLAPSEYRNRFQGNQVETLPQQAGY